MTKIKNTKKGMAKKTLSMSLVVAMLATSNVPVWAAEFSDGSDATAVTSEAEAPAVSDDTSETVAAQAVAPQDVTVSTDANVMSLSAVENDGITITTTYRNGSSKDTGCVAFYALSDNDSIEVGKAHKDVATSPLGWIYVGGSGDGNVAQINAGTYKLTLDKDKWKQTVGKKIACVVYQDTTNDSYNYQNGTVVAVTDVKIVPNTAQDYCTTKKKNAAWGNELPKNPTVTMNYGATLENGAWYKDGQKVADGYKTTLADVGSVFKYKGTLSNTGDPDFDDETVVAQELTITGKTNSVVSRVAWSGFSTEIVNNGNLTCDYDGNAHQLTIDNFTTNDGQKVSDAKFKYTYTRNGTPTSDFTGAGEITVTATVEEAGVLAKGTTITATLKIKGIDISKDTAATLTANPLVYNKAGKYLDFSEKTGDDLTEAVTKAGLVVEKNGKALTYGSDKDYTVTSRVVKNEVGTEKVEVTITGQGNYTGTVLKKLDITAADISKATVSDIAAQGYTGNQIKPAAGTDFTVKLNGDTLVYNADSSKSDYTLEYSNNVNVGKDATVTITGRGNYTGSISKKFEIKSIGLDKLKAEILKDTKLNNGSTIGTGYDYTGSAIDPIKDSYGYHNGSTVVEAVWMKGRDFSVTYIPQNTNAGDVKAVITGINNYAGQTEEITFKINPVDISKVKANLSNVTYSPDLKDKKDEIKAGLKVTYKDTQLTENQDFTIDSVDITGKKVALKLTGIKNFKGTATVYADVTAKDISTVTLPKIDAQKYTGYAITATPSADGLKLVSNGSTLVDKLALKDGNTVLTGSDYYVINIENNKNVGTATINLGGKGNYTGKVSLSFPIVDQELNGTIVDSATKSTVLKDIKYSYAAASTVKGITYAGTYYDNATHSTQNFALKIMDEKGNDITDKCNITYSDNKAVGTATITATGRDGYKFNAVNTFRITPAKINDATLKGRLSLKKTPATFDYTGDEIKPEYTFTAKDGDYTLVEGTDYKVEYVNNVDAYTATVGDTKSPIVKVTGLGNYAGKDADGKEITIPAYFTIRKVDLASTDIVANDVAYASGVAVKPNVVITNSKSGKALVEGTDYKVTITKGGTNVGPAEAKIELTEKGTKNYNLDSSIATVKFNVTPLDLSKATISKIDDQTATGEQIKPAFVVMNGSVRLVEGYDYEVSYGENKEVGEGTVTIKALDSNKNYTGSQTVKFNIVEKAAEVGQAMISNVVVKGNTVTPVLSGEVDGAVGYDYVIATEEDYKNGRVDISKNILKTNTDFHYVQKGTYYAYCHAWKRGADGKKVFGEWSKIYKFTVKATTPSTPKITKVTVKGNTVTVTYTKSSNATGYDVILGSAVKSVNGEKRPVDYGTLVKKNIKGNVVTATFKNVPAGKYYAGVHSFNKTSEDGKKVFSKWSNSKAVTVK